jgi:glucose uptake protein GlcU
MMSLGLAFALLTVLLWGSWSVVTKTLPIDARVQTFWLTVGHLLLVLSLFMLTGSTVTAAATVAPLVAGVLWGAGMIGGIVGIRHLGMTRAIGIWVPAVIIVSALWGLFYFRELWTFDTDRLLLSGLAIFLVILAAVLVILSKEDTAQVKNARVGIIAALVLGILHGSYFVPLHSSTFSVIVTYLPVSVGMVLLTFAVGAFSRLGFFHDPLSMARMVVAGIIQAGGNYMALLTISYLGVSLGYPLTQCAIVVATLWGTLFFKEVTTLRGKRFVFSGVTIVLVGAVLLNFARTV